MVWEDDMEDRFARRPRQRGRERPPIDPNMIDIWQVAALTGIGRSTIYVYMRTQGFPRPIQVGVRAVRWVRAEVLAWLAKRRRGGPPPRE